MSERLKGVRLNFLPIPIGEKCSSGQSGYYSWGSEGSNFEEERRQGKGPAVLLPGYGKYYIFPFSLGII